MINRTISSIQTTRVLRFEQGVFTKKNDILAIEAPLEIQITSPDKAPETMSITMRTPGHDAELALGLLVAEGLLFDKNQLDKTTQPDPNTIQLYVKKEVVQTNIFKDRTFLSNSSCGVCGKNSLDFMQVQPRFSLKNASISIKTSLVFALSKKLNAKQQLFKQTGGNHAAALFDLHGNLLVIREDVGRHNALDKLVGWAFLEASFPLHTHVLMLSGRISFELVQKAAMAGIGVLVAVGAPSSLAVDLASELGMTLIGFLKNTSFNVYTCPERIEFNEER